jgi:hypothetical protein
VDEPCWYRPMSSRGLRRSNRKFTCRSRAPQ